MTRTVLVVHPSAELFGSDRMMLESVMGFIESGCRVVVVVPEQGPLIESAQRAGAEVVIAPMLVLRKALMRPSAWGRLLAESFRGMRAALSLISRVRPDVVYVSTITIPEWPILARMRGVPTVSHIHEAEASGSRLVNIALYLPHLASRRALVNSEFSLATVRRVLPRLARRASVVYNGVAGPREVVPLRETLDGGLRVLYIGRLSPRKGPDVVIDAAALLARAGHDVSVSIAGTVFPGYEWYEQQLRAQAAAADLRNPVSFLGFQPDIWPHLAASDVLVVPSRLDEPFGNTAVEGLLAERPVIASDTSGLREAAGGYPTAWLVAPDDPDALERVLARLSNEWITQRAVAESAAAARSRHDPALYRARVSELTLTKP